MPPDLNHAIPLSSSLVDDVRRVRWAGWLVAGFLTTLLIGGVVSLGKRTMDNSERIGRNEERIELNYRQLRDGQEQMQQDIRTIVMHLKDHPE